jgi:hypothetical protein
MTDQHGGHDASQATAAGHGGAGGHDEALGPVDLAMWGVGVLGVAVGLLVCLCFAFATGVL